VRQRSGLFSARLPAALAHGPPPYVGPPKKKKSNETRYWALLCGVWVSLTEKISIFGGLVQNRFYGGF
jgi:hypothetical protein